MDFGTGFLNEDLFLLRASWVRGKLRRLARARAAAADAVILGRKLLRAKQFIL